MNDINELDRYTVRRFGRTAALLGIHAVLLAALTLVQKATGTALACPDWPLCYGKLVPVFDESIFLVWVARVFTILTLVAYLGAWLDVMRTRVLRESFAGTATLGIFLLMTLVTSQAFSVWTLGEPPAQLAETAASLALVAVTLTLGYRARLIGTCANFSPLHRIPPELRLAFTVVAAFAGLMAISGVMVLSYGGSGACPDFPTCRGLWLPTGSLPVRLVVLHRIGAALLFLMSLGLSLICASMVLPFGARLTLRCLPVLIVIQTGIGVYGGGGPVMASLHAVLAVAVVAIAVRGAVEAVVVGANPVTALAEKRVRSAAGVQIMREDASR